MVAERTRLGGGVISGPAELAVAVTKSDSTTFSEYTRGIYVGVGGDLAVMMVNASGVAASVTFVGVPSGSYLPISTNQVLSTGTTAASIVRMW